VYLRVPLKGAKAAHVHILSTDEYLKVRDALLLLLVPVLHYHLVVTITGRTAGEGVRVDDSRVLSLVTRLLNVSTQVHFPPFLLEAFLFEAVDEAKSSAKVGDGVAAFTLPKKIHRPWDNLVLTISKPDGCSSGVPVPRPDDSVGLYLVGYSGTNTCMMTNVDFFLSLLNMFQMISRQ